jgi:hypothetical protein
MPEPHGGLKRRRTASGASASLWREPMKLMTYYIALTLAGNVIAAIVCLGIEKLVPWISMPIFLALFFAILWGAWVLAVKWTEPQTRSAPVVGATSDQRA